jgi:hypothetical protein
MLVARRSLRPNPRLGKFEDTGGSTRECAGSSVKYAMSEQETHTIKSDAKKLRLEQAQAMLDLFEADRGRAAATLEELKEWACTQDNEHLQLRVDQFLESCGSDRNPARLRSEPPQFTGLLYER